MIKVLVVDNELEVCNFLERTLAREGYQVIIATSGMQAIEKVNFINRLEFNFCLG